MRWSSLTRTCCKPRRRRLPGATETAAITAWRKPESTGSLPAGRVDRSTPPAPAKVDLLAEWDDPYDDLSQPRLRGGGLYPARTPPRSMKSRSPPRMKAHLITGSGTPITASWPITTPTTICCASPATATSSAACKSGVTDLRRYRPAPLPQRHPLPPRAATPPAPPPRFREYFPQDQDLDFTRSSQPVKVDVPASARPAVPLVNYLMPTFGWQRQTQTNLKRSVRFGGGLRIYLERPWFSSGEASCWA